MYIKRTIEKKLKYMSEHFPVVMICGARQVGKTTVLKKYRRYRECPAGKKVDVK